jgi:hypothetical protein
MPGTDELPPDLGGYRDVRCSFCDRHNRDVHTVAGRDGLRICQVCVAKCAEAIDADAGVPPPPGGWADRWPPKRVPEK